MTVEHKELVLDMPNNCKKLFHILGMFDDKGEEKIWEMHSFLEEMLPPLYFESKEEYMEHVNQWDEIFEFPVWDDVSIPGVGAVLSAASNHLSQKEIHQWLFDLLYEMWKAYQVKTGYNPEQKVQIDPPSLDLDGLRVPKTTIGILLKTPTPCLSMIYLPDMPDFDPPKLGIAMSMNAYMALGNDRIPYHLVVPVVWNVTQNRPNIFSRGDKYKVRFVTINDSYIIDHPEYMTSWETMPYSQVWNLWK